MVKKSLIKLNSNFFILLLVYGMLVLATAIVFPAIFPAKNPFGNAKILPQKYVNWQFGYSVDYPANFHIEDESRLENKGDTHEMVLLRDKVYPFLYIRVYSQITSKKYLGLNPTEELLINGYKTYKYIYDEGPCDGPGCTPQSVVYKIEKDGKEYVLDFVYTTKLTSQQKSILSSFKFVKR